MCVCVCACVRVRVCVCVCDVTRAVLAMPTTQPPASASWTLSFGFVVGVFVLAVLLVVTVLHAGKRAITAPPRCCICSRAQPDKSRHALSRILGRTARVRNESVYDTWVALLRRIIGSKLQQPFTSKYLCRPCHALCRDAVELEAGVFVLRREDDGMDTTPETPGGLRQWRILRELRKKLRAGRDGGSSEDEGATMSSRETDVVGVEREAQGDTEQEDDDGGDTEQEDDDGGAEESAASSDGIMSPVCRVSTCLPCTRAPAGLFARNVTIPRRLCGMLCPPGGWRGL